MKQNLEVLDKVVVKFEEAGLLPPLAVKPKLSKRDKLIVHVFLDHIYLNVIKQLETTIEELDQFRDDEEIQKLIIFLNETLLKESQFLFDIWSEKIDSLPNLEELDAFIGRLKEEAEKTNSLSLVNMLVKDLSPFKEASDNKESTRFLANKKFID